MDFISITRIWEQLLFNIRWLIYYLWWSIANWNTHFSFLHHMSEANASYLEWNGKCFITKLFHLKRRFYEAHLRCMKQSCGLWSTPVGVWSEAFSGFMFFCHSKMLLWDCLHFIQAIPHFLQKNGGKRGIRTLGSLRPGGFQDRCLKPLDHLSACVMTTCICHLLKMHPFCVFFKSFL